MTCTLAEVKLIEHQGSPFEYVLLAVGALMTLALLAAFVIFLLHQRGK